MKIGILTFHGSINEGAVMQCYSLCHRLMNDFPDAKIAARSAEESWQNGVLTCTMHFTFRANIAVRAGAS